MEVGLCVQGPIIRQSPTTKVAYDNYKLVHRNLGGYYNTHHSTKLDNITQYYSNRE